jgi:hypothetical protein
MKISDRGLIYGTIPAFSAGTEETHENPSQHSLWPKSEPGISRKLSRNANDLSAPLVSAVELE